MQHERYGEKVMHRLLTSLLGIAACAVAAAPPAFAGEDPSAAPARPSAGQPAATPQGAGMIIYIDPQTGAIRQDPAPGTLPLELSPQERNAMSTSHEGLVEVPSTVPGGGVMIDLQGRFQSPLIGTIDADGKLNMQHLGEPPRSGREQ
jgi:hypothetical protein